MEKAEIDNKGFTLIELLIVVAIIGILAAVAIPGYIGMQDRARKGAIQRTATSSEPELQGWINAAKKSGTMQGALFEVDTNWDGKVDRTSDKNNDDLAGSSGDNVVSIFAAARNVTDKSPWGGDLWVGTGSPCAPTAGQICLQQNGAGGQISSISMVAYDGRQNALYVKILSAD